MLDSPELLQQPEISVLLVDGHGDFTRTVDEFLRRQPHLTSIRLLCTDQDLLHQATYRRPCVVLVDLDTSGVDSLALIRRLRLRRPDLGIVVLSLSMDNAHYQAATQAGADALVGKALLVQDLMPAIRRALRWGTPVVFPPTNLDT